jgi:hypothetical protein
LSIEEIKMDSTISTKDLKSKLDKKQGITVVETLALNATVKPISPEL